MLKRQLLAPLMVTGLFSACLASYEKANETDTDATATGGSVHSGGRNTAGRGGTQQLQGGSSGLVTDGGRASAQAGDTSSGGTDQASTTDASQDGDTGPINTGLAGGGSGGTLGSGGGIAHGGTGGTNMGGTANAGRSATVANAGRAASAGATSGLSSGGAAAAAGTTVQCAATRTCNTHPGFDGKGECKAGSQALTSADSTGCHYATCGGDQDRAQEGCGPTFSDANCNGIHGDGDNCDASGALNESSQVCLKKVRFCRNSSSGVALQSDSNCNTNDVAFTLTLFVNAGVGDSTKPLYSCSIALNDTHSSSVCSYIALGECGNSITGTLIGYVASQGTKWQMPSPPWPEYTRLAVPTSKATCSDGVTPIPKAPVDAATCTNCDMSVAYYVLH